MHFANVKSDKGQRDIMTYLHQSMLDSPRHKDNFLMPYFENNEHWIVTALLPKDGQAYFFDSRRDPNKSWTNLKKVLDAAVLMCHKSTKTVMPHSCYKFHTSFCCRQQPKDESFHKYGYYAMALMDDYVRAGPLLRSHSMLMKWSKENEEDVKLSHFWTEHERFQRVFTNIINRAVVRGCSTARQRTKKNET